MNFHYKQKESIINFCRLEKGILQIIQSADIYTICLVAYYSNTVINQDLIKTIISKRMSSGFVVSDDIYDKDTLLLLEKEGNLKDIGNQIVLSTYTAFEIYLIEKFREYYKFLLNDKDHNFVENTVKRFSLRSLEEIKKLYKDILQIHIHSFNIPCRTWQSNSTFESENSWELINLLSKVRNDIAHKGESDSYKIITLLDSWSPFDFIRNWVQSFDVNFDFVIYGGSDRHRIKGYTEK